MEQPGTKSNEISFVETAGDITTVKAKGVSIEFHADGSILVYTDGPVKVCPVSHFDAKPAPIAELKIGGRLAGGTMHGEETIEPGMNAEYIEPCMPKPNRAAHASLRNMR
jgi:hypothetical protein